MVAVRVVVHGRVQDVTFRASCRREAERTGVAGWVRNVFDGTVEAHFEGPAEQVEHMVGWCGRGPLLASVSQVDREPVDPEGLADFQVR
ncbi:acylphosphatase [Desertihabitans brevis]|uniref:acylphosphatase n=1 Tax=Desertihabitans brevis TaxID=2268447 RepID=A0A367YTU6_9ACTN|nr:acylphosphatase [Desertihabitans brevis]RCK69306.1 acylphosphatase [Desertihabitans brevis]